MLSASNLSKSFGSKPVLSSLSFELSSGEILFFTGSSGCGKTTALRIISNLASADSGDVLLNGCPRHEYNPALWRSLVTFVSQERSNMNGTPAELFSRVIAFRARRFPLETLHIPPETLRQVEVARTANMKQFLQICRSIGLQDSQVLEQNWSELSGGQMQRASVAIALACKPAVLLLDEATAHCDPYSTLLVEKAVKNSGASVIWVSHDTLQPARVGGKVICFDSPV